MPAEKRPPRPRAYFDTDSRRPALDHPAAPESGADALMNRPATRCITSEGQLLIIPTVTKIQQAAGHRPPASRLAPMPIG